MDCEKDKMYFYQIGEDIDNIKMNKNETFKEQCDRGIRPRMNLLPLVKKNKTPILGYFDYKTGEYVKCLD